MNWGVDRQDYSCDFPGCLDQYDGRPNAKCAIRKEHGEYIAMAFCRKHAEKLRNEGVILKTFNEIHDEIAAPTQKKERERIAREERTFIDGLKAGQDRK